MTKKVHAKISKLDSEESSINLSIPAFVTYSIVILTIGASFYTLVNAVPKIEELNKLYYAESSKLGQMEVRLEDIQKQVQDGQNKGAKDNTKN